MKNDNIYNIFDRNSKKLSHQSIAFHQAGHAAAIYLNNKAQNQPPVFFQINLKDIRRKPTCPRRMEGGRLIQSLPLILDDTDDCMAAFEADIVNLLVGPLAEAKYVHTLDDELFSRKLLNITALNYYGGREKVSLINEYLQSLYSGKQQQDEKLQQLFDSAFNFVNSHANWQAIIHLARYLYESTHPIIRYEEVVSVLESITAKNRSIPGNPAIEGWGRLRNLAG